jgi:glycosyltransferase involved in cell wall biosynthesis
VVQRRPDAFLLLIGGSEEQVATHRALAAELGLEGHCRFTGQVAQAVVRQHLRKASVLTSPRAQGTNTPLKIYEQLASGLPLVATRIRSHTQVLDDGVCFLVDPDPAAMAEGILSALEDPVRRAEVVRNARALYDREYSRTAYVGKMRALVEALR